MELRGSSAKQKIGIDHNDCVQESTCESTSREELNLVGHYNACSSSDHVPTIVALKSIVHGRWKVSLERNCSRFERRMTPTADRAVIPEPYTLHKVLTVTVLFQRCKSASAPVIVLPVWFLRRSAQTMREIVGATSVHCKSPVLNER